MNEVPDDTTLRASIELQGEAQYRAAMAEINRQLRETKSALSAAAAEFANADAATRTSTAQAEALTQSLEQQRERMALMQAQLEKVEEKYGKNSKAAVELRTKINNARAEMAKTETQLRGLGDGLDAAAGAAQSAGEDMNGAAAGFDKIGDSAQRAQDDVQSLAGEIGQVVGQKLIEFEVGKKALEQLASGFKWALGEAIQGQAEDAQTRALAGDDALSERRMQIKDAIDRTWAGQRDGSQTVNDVAAVDTVLGNKGITDMERVKSITDMAITQSVVFSQSVQDVMDRATAMVNAFGITYEDAIDLMTKGMRDMSDGGAQMLSAFETYPQVFKQLGYSAEEMYSAIATASNDANLGEDSAFVKGVETFINTVTSGSKESKKTLKELGIEVTDLPKKFQQGGEAAEEATQLILGKLNAIADEAKRNDLGKALFGDKVWTDSAGGIADVILSGYGRTVDAAGATMDAMQRKLDTLGDAWAGFTERIGQKSGSIFDPMLDWLKSGLQTVNGAIDELDAGAQSVQQEIESTRQSVGTSIDELIAARDQAFRQGDIAWAEELNKQIRQAGDAIEDGYDRIEETASDSRWIDTLKEKNAEAAQVAEQMNQNVEAQRADLDKKLAEINQAITDADIAGNYAEAARLTQERDQIISDIAQMAAEVKENYSQMGEDAADAVEKQGPKMQSAADSMGQQGVDALLDKQPDMMDAGNLMGSAGVLGTQAGLSDMYDAGMNGAEGVVGGLKTGIDDAYRAGYDTGKAYERGFKNAQGIRSPSRVMRLAAQYSVEGLLTGYDERESEVYARGAALADAFTGGYGARGTFKSPDTGDYAAGAGISSTELADAIRGALSGLGLYFDGQRTGEVLTPGISGTIARRSAATVRGRSARIKGW